MAKSIEDLVAQHVRRWEQRESSAPRRPRSAPAQRPVITVSSAYGAMGAEVGRIAAKLLGFDFYDRALVDAISRSANIREQVIRSLDERARDVINESIVQMFEARQFGASDYRLHLSRVLATLGRHGDAVVVGRGAQFVLDAASTLRVRAVAPVAVRVERVENGGELSIEEATALVGRKDVERRTFCKDHFDRNVTAPEHYDLVVNTASLTVRQAAEIVTLLFRLRFLGAAEE